MAKRFTDTDKWKKPFIRGLRGAYKLLWMYICDDCDHAGIWQVDFEVARIRIGEDVDINTARNVFAGKVSEIDGGEKWFIPSFIEFQYPSGLNPQNNAHSSVIAQLKKFSLVDEDFKIKPLMSPSRGALDMDMVKDKEMDKEIQAEKLPKVDKSKKSKHSPEIENPFSPEFASGIWATWKQYRSQIRKPLNSVLSESAALRQLYKFSDGKEPTATQIIEKSIANGWQGLFEPDKKVLPLHPESTSNLSTKSGMYNPPKSQTS